MYTKEKTKFPKFECQKYSIKLDQQFVRLKNTAKNTERNDKQNQLKP